MKSRIPLLIILASIFIIGCGGSADTPETNAGGNESASASPGSLFDNEPEIDPSVTVVVSSPSDAIRTIVDGVRLKNSEMIRSALSKATIDRFDSMAREENKSFYEIFVGEDYEEMSKIPAVRNERIDGDTATLEFQSSRTGDWEPLPFVKEDGNWKLAIADGVQKEDF